MTFHDVVWRSPSPVWFAQRRGLDGTGRRTLRRPAILRFERDSFMDDYLQILEADPPRLEEFLVSDEASWLAPTPTPAAASLFEPPSERVSIAARTILRGRRARARTNDRIRFDGTAAPTPTPIPPKLYQPAHQRYYLVTASLVCRTPGLPDKRVDAGKNERASFVVRRLLPRTPVAQTQALPVPDPYAWQDTYDEYAFVSKNGQTGWVPPNGSTLRLATGEEENPLFGSRYDDDNGKNRRVMGGFIPVVNRETYMGAPELDPGVLEDGEDPAAARDREIEALKALLQQKVIEPWTTLIELVEDAVRASTGEKLDPALNEPDEAAQLGALKQVDATIATASWYVILDFMLYLKSYCGELWTSIVAQNRPAAGQSRDLYDRLGQIWLRNPEASPASTTLRDALREIRDQEELLEAVTVPYVFGQAATDGWPAKGYLLVDPEDFWTVHTLFPKRRFADGRGPYESTIRDIRDMVAAIKPRPADGVSAPDVPEAARLDKGASDGWFVLRCVYQRPDCGDVHPPTLSEPSIPFQMATFFDPDAPARPIRIQLPIDTTPAGLRKYAKNTAFVLPSQLCGQLKGLRKYGFGDLVRSVLPWPFHKDLSVSGVSPCGDDGDEGLVCSLSIPIVTVCALIILIMIAKLLDQFFRWFPFLITCFPVPGLQSKRP